jgi:hypothetical protein
MSTDYTDFSGLTTPADRIVETVVSPFTDATIRKGLIAGIDRRTAATIAKGLTVSHDVAYVPKGRLELPAGLVPLMKQHKRYLQGRGFDADDLVRLWGIQAIGLAVDLAWRIFIPAYYQGQVVSWTTRSISDNVTSRYWSAGQDQESMPLKHLLYGEQYCQNTVIVTEGPLDAWAIGPGAVSVCGVSYTQQQVSRMVRYPTRVICFDNEPDAQRRALKLAESLSAFNGDTYNVLLSGKDAASSPKREIELLRREFLEN